MPGKIYSKIEIDAPLDRIWSILTDFPLYNTWNPYINDFQGRLSEFAGFKGRLIKGNGKSIRFHSLLTKLKIKYELQWRERYSILPGIFSGKRTIVIESLSRSSSLFIHSFSFSGILSPLLYPFYRKNFYNGIEKMNSALQKRAESKT